MSNYRKSKQHIEVVQKQKNNTEIRCANQRKQLALMNAQIKNYKELLKEAKDIIEWYKTDCGYVDLPTKDLLTKIDKVLGENNEKKNNF